jgi:prepilin-type N-terminal cleavage/methylation domain-containing protein
MKNIKGFTLIELLVVVLIIGILAAIALPQYQKAVERAKILPYLSLLSSLNRSADLYKLTTGSGPQRFDDLDIEIPISEGDSSCGLPIASNVAYRKDFKVIQPFITVNLSTVSSWANIYLCKNSPKYGAYMFSTDHWYKTNKTVCYELRSSSKTPCATLFDAQEFSHGNAQAERFYYMP